MHFRTYLREYVVIVEIGGPHRLVHIRHKAQIRVAQDIARECGPGIGANLFGDFGTAAHHYLHVCPGNPLHGSRGFEGTDESA